MKRAWLLLPIAGLVGLILIPLTLALGDDDPGPSTLAAALGNSITYQGRFTDGDEPADGSYDIRFILWDSESGGMQVGSTITKEDIAVSGGLFTTTLDFGAAAFDGDARWLEIAVRPGTSSEAYTILNPRQPITAVPYALHALTAGGFALPFAGTADDDTDPLLDLTQDGDGGAISATSNGAGAAISATAAGDGPALEASGDTAISLDGGIEVTGTDRAAFKVVVDTAANTCDYGGGTDNAVAVDNVHANGNAAALLLVTFDDSTNNSAASAAYGVAYDVGGDCPADQWVIFVGSGSLVDDDAFNVLVINPS